MKVFVTKYALTKGIEVVEVEYVPGSAYTFVERDEKDSFSKEQFIMGEDAFLTYKEAAVAARAMRNKEELSLKKQLKKISGLIFDARMPDNLKAKL